MSRPRALQCVPGGWHWASNEIASQIVKACENPGTCLAIYYALCWISSEEKKPKFRASLSSIASKCGLSSRTVWREIGRLEKAGFILIDRAPTDSRIPNEYTLLFERITPNDQSEN